MKNNPKSSLPSLFPNNSIEFYALGKVSPSPSLINMAKVSNPANSDSSANIYQRNHYSNNVFENEPRFVHSNKQHFDWKSPIKDNNNYLSPISQFNRNERSPLSDRLGNQRLYHQTRSKNYVNEGTKMNLVESGNMVQKKDFNLLKESFESIKSPFSGRALEDVNVKFDKNHKGMIRFPTYTLKKRAEEQGMTNVSNKSPDWFHIVTEKTKKETEDKLRKEETIFLLSRYKKWVTVTPRSKNRRRPLELAKVENMELTSPVMPHWMQIKSKKPEEQFKRHNFNSSITNKKLAILVDKDQTSNKSIFSLGDYRHNVITKEDSQEGSKNVKVQEKMFFNWMDEKAVFDPKSKKDIRIRRSVE